MVKVRNSNYLEQFDLQLHYWTVNRGSSVLRVPGVIGDSPVASALPYWSRLVVLTYREPKAALRRHRAGSPARPQERIRSAAVRAAPLALRPPGRAALVRAERALAARDGRPPRSGRPRGPADPRRRRGHGGHLAAARPPGRRPRRRRGPDRADAQAGRP